MYLLRRRPINAAIERVLAAKKRKINKGGSNGRKDSRWFTDHMVRVKSSNVWGYSFDIDPESNFGTLYVAFKNKAGGRGDIYRYYNVPLRIYQKFITAPSKGRFVWRALRYTYEYSKLTGDKRGKFPNAVNR